MQVFLIPIGASQYEPYYEPVEGDDAPPADEAGWLARQRRRLGDMLREAEEERHRHHTPGAAPHGALGRLRRRLMRWIVERAAEQRLLWHLRTAEAATLHVPDDLAAADALGVLRLGLKRDADRHFRWFLLHLVLLILSGVFFFIPGPNLIGYFFTFTTAGHLLAWRGAARGGTGVDWSVDPSAALTEIRALLPANAPDREARLHAVAERLGLRHLVTFVEKLALPPA
jgi:hypothetical protein